MKMKTKSVKNIFNYTNAVYTKLIHPSLESEPSGTMAGVGRAAQEAYNLVTISYTSDQ